MTLHDRIMALQPIGKTSQVSAIHFNNAKMRAAQLVTEADELMAEQHDVIKAFYVWAQEEGRTEAAKLIDGVLAKYNAYKEQ